MWHILDSNVNMHSNHECLLIVQNVIIKNGKELIENPFFLMSRHDVTLFLN